MPINFSHVFYSYSGSKDSLKISTALNDICFEVKNHFFLGIIGHTGSGKSTLIQQINGLLIPTKGKVMVDDFLVEHVKKRNKNQKKEIKKLRKHVGVVFQFPEYQLFEENVLKDVAFGPKNFGIEEQKAFEISKNALKEVGIDESYYEKSPFELSGGEKRRVAIAGILALEPEILVLDEPTAGLDPQGEKEIMELFYRLYQKGKNIIMVSHDYDNVLKYCTDLIVLKNGCLVSQTKPCDFFFSKECVENEIEPPEIVKFAKLLIDNGKKLNIEKIKDIDSLITELKETD